jgi:hypothetical protein
VDRKKIRYVVCEGPDDLAVLRVMLNEVDDRKQCSGVKRQGIVYETERVALRVESARDAKSGLALHALDRAEGTAAERPDMIGVVFDPDDDPQAHEFDFFERDYNRIATRDRRGTTLKSVRMGFQVSIHGREVQIRRGAWRSALAPVFAGLPDEHCLERVLIDGILSSTITAPIATWAHDSTAELRKLVQDHGWKRAFRIWNAALEPKAESFADKLLEAPATRAACLAALRATPVAQLVQCLLAD